MQIDSLHVKEKMKLSDGGQIYLMLIKRTIVKSETLKYFQYPKKNCISPMKLDKISQSFYLHFC